MTHNSKVLRDLIIAAVEQGWVVVPTKKQHIAFRSPSGSVIYAAGTPSDHRSLKNTRSLLKRAGLKDV